MENRQLARNRRLFHFFTFLTLAVYSICSFELNVKIFCTLKYVNMARINNISFFRFLLEKRKIRLAVCKDLSCNCLFELLPLNFIHVTLLTAGLLQKFAVFWKEYCLN